MTEIDGDEEFLEQRDQPLTKVKPKALHGNERLLFFSDGIFAITITLLVLEIKVPEIEPELVATELPKALHHLFPSVMGYIISFVVLGLYWIAHHNMFMHVKHHNHVLLWLNTLFLMFIAFVPFTTALLSRYPDQQFPVIAYAAILACVGVVLNIIWWYSTTHHLVDDDTDPAFIAFVHRYIRIAPIAYAGSILASFVSLAISKFIFIAIAIFYIIPKPYHRKHYRQLERRFNQ